MKFRVLLIALALLAAWPLSAGEPLRIEVSPAVAIEPADLTVRASVERDSANRALEIVAESPEFYRSSQIQLDGANAPHTSYFQFRDLPSGTYQVSARLMGPDDTVRVAIHREVDVIAVGGR